MKAMRSALIAGSDRRRVSVMLGSAAAASGSDRTSGKRRLARRFIRPSKEIWLSNGERYQLGAAIASMRDGPRRSAAAVRLRSALPAGHDRSRQPGIEPPQTVPHDPARISERAHVL